MSKIDLISGKWSDLVFEGRNKQYGAYVLRQNTGKRNVWAMIGILLLGVVIWGGLTLKNIVDEANARALADQAAELSALQEAEVQKEEKEPEVERQQIEEQKVEEKVEEVKSSVAFQVPEIKPDELVKNEVKSQDDIMEKKEAIGDYDVKGNNEDAAKLEVKEAIMNEPVKEVVEEKEEPKPEPVVVKEEPPVVEDKVFEVVEQQPSFPGGTAALMQYLSSNIKYPVVAQENGVQGRVVVGFIVDKDGSITNVNVLRGVDPSLDREAERVVKSMPKWVPGKQNGQAVKVKFNVPVTFKLQ